MKFPKSNEYNSPEGTREKNTKEMAKKNYKSPKMEEVEVQVESLIAAGSCVGQNAAGGTGGCDGCE